jgi:hypothetical protein
MQMRQGVPRGMFVKNIPMMFVENKTTTNKHHIFKKWEEDQWPYFDYIVVAMNNSLDYQTTHAKVLSSHFCEQQKMMENMLIQSFQIFTT